MIVRTHLEALKAEPAAAPKAEADPAIALLQKMLDEQLTPLREQVNWLENELHDGGGGGN